MKQKVVQKFKDYVLNHYFIIEEKDGDLVFHLKHGVPFAKNKLMVKHRKNGKRILKEIKSSKAVLTKCDLCELEDLGVYDIYLQMFISGRYFLLRSNFNLQNACAVLMDDTNQRIFDPYRNFNNNLSFNYHQRMFLARATGVEKISNSINLEGEIELLEDLDFDSVETFVTIRGNRHYLPSEYSIENGTIKFKSNIYFEAIEDDLDRTARIRIRLRKDGMIVGSSSIKMNSISGIEDKYIDYIENYDSPENYDDYVTYFYFNQNFHLACSIMPKKNIPKLLRNEKRFVDFYSKVSRKEIMFFESFHGKSYAGQPKYIYERLLELGFDKQFDFIWSYEGDLDIPGNPLITSRGSNQFNDFLRKSKYWITNISFPIIKPDNDIIYIQTTHGTPYKHMGADIEVKNEAIQKGRVLVESETWNYLLSPNDFCEEVFARAFEYDGTIINKGYPANDIFYRDNSDKKARLLKELNIPKDKKVILYTPTFRDNDIDEDKKHQFSLLLDLKKLYDELSEDHVLIIRLHYILSKNLELTDELKDFIIDLSEYDDIADLYLIADMLITDYSSAFVDYAHSRKPILFFVPDFEEYSAFRGLYTEIKDNLPGPELYTNDELIDSIKNIDDVERQYKEKYDVFYDMFCDLGHGTATDDVIDIIFKEVKK